MNAKRVKFALPQLGMLIFTGSEARHFLQGQLSCDTAKLAVGNWVWGGYLTTKGRLLTTFLTLGLADDRIGLVMDQSLLPLALDKFKMYVLRAKVQIEHATLSWYGRVDDPDSPAAGTLSGSGDSWEAGLGANMSVGCGTSPAPEHNAAAEQAWHAGCAAAGMPWFGAVLQDKLTVHMVSLDLIGGVDFDKGCYIGQEIVIRSHHRGAIKRRAYLVNGAGLSPAPATALYSAVHGKQAAGQMLYAAAVGAGYRGLASVRKDAVVEGELRLDDDRVLQVQEPPYGTIDPRFETR